MIEKVRDPEPAKSVLAKSAVAKPAAGASGAAKTELTKRQTEILDFIKRYLEKNGYPPTVRDIGGAVGLTSSSTVHAHLSNLEKAGAIRRDPTKPRALEVMGEKVKRAAGRAAEAVADGVAAATSGLPLIGHVAAGEPILAEQNIEEYIEVPRIGGGDEADFVLSVRGDSMQQAGILDGDFVVVRSQQNARDGEIVVALVENEATVKRFYREPDHVRLEPENDAYEPIRSRDAEVIGSVVGVFRRVA
ncbi:MAG: transcriptional repressor LexA [Actinobacteria bacterium]|nr:transcriptional repressor LexA [Actinomycetota bacterium]